MCHLGFDFLILLHSLFQNHGHQENILYVAQSPPCLLATFSYDGEIVVWNVTSGHSFCKLNISNPSYGLDYGEGR